MTAGVSKVPDADVARLATPDIEDATAVRFQPEKFQEGTTMDQSSLDSRADEAAEVSIGYLFTGRRGSNCSLTTRQYARLLGEWTSVRS